MSSILTNIKNKQMEEIIELYGDKIKNINDLTGGEEPSLLFFLLARNLRYLMDEKPEDVLSERGILIRRRINFIIKALGKNFLSSPQIFENREQLMYPDKGIVGPDKEIVLPEEPVIWVANHAFKDDTLATILGAKRHAYILFGSLPQFYNTIDGVTSYINGVVMINRKLKSSKSTTVPKGVYAMQHGVDLMMFPEAVWNKEPDRLLLDLWAGAYRIAQETGAKIVPQVHYIRDTTLEGKINPIHTVLDDPIDITNMSEKNALNYLRDIMATWFYLMMEKYGKSTREELLSGYSSYDEAWEAELRRRIATTKRYDEEIEFKADYRPKDIITPESVWQDIADIEHITKDNASAIAYAMKLVKERKTRDFQHRF